MPATPIVTIHQPQYLPYIGLLAKIDAADTCVLFDTAQFQKGYFDNRNVIRDRCGEKVWLTIPVAVKSGVAIKDTAIAADGWQRKHLETLKQAYGKAAFFKQFYEEFEQILRGREYGCISEIAEETIKWLCRSFGITTAFLRASDLWDGVARTPAATLAYNTTKARGGSYLAGPSWKYYLNTGDIVSFFHDGICFLEASITEARYKAHNGYYPNTSAIDLLFSQGRDGLRVIRDSILVSEVRL